MLRLTAPETEGVHVECRRHELGSLKFIQPREGREVHSLHRPQ